MEINDYAGNSHKQKQELAEKEERQPNTKDIRVREQSVGKKFFHTFITEDLADVREVIFYDYIVPGIKEGIRSFVDLLLGGDGRISRGSSSSSRSRNSYDKYYDRGRRDSDRRRDDDDRRRKLSYDDFIFTTRTKAEQVRNDLLDDMSHYESVSVSDFYDVLKENGFYVDDRERAYTDNNYGWYDLGPCRIEQVRGGYIIKLPRPVALD